MTESMRVGEIRYSALPMEYPPTSSEGIAIVYNIETWDSHDSAFNDVRRVVYILLLLIYLIIISFFL